MVSFEDFNFQRTCWYFIKNILCIKCTVVITNTRMVTTYDEMSGTHVLAEICMKYSLTWTSVQHIETITGYHCAVRWEVKLNHFTNGSITNWCRNITFFQFTQQHVNYQAITAQTIHCHVAKFFVSQVHWVTGLECYNFFPATFLDFIANFYCSTKSIWEFSLEIGEVQDLDRTRNGKATLTIESNNARML